MEVRNSRSGTRSEEGKDKKVKKEAKIYKLKENKRNGERIKSKRQRKRGLYCSVLYCIVYSTIWPLYIGYNNIHEYCKTNAIPNAYRQGLVRELLT